MKHFVDAYLAGKPLIACAPARTPSVMARIQKVLRQINWNGKGLPGGFGKQVLANLGRPSRRPQKRSHSRIIEPARPTTLPPGSADLFGDTDVYTANPRRM